ncbi:hypothetical protein SADUNF_Sadunf03G0168700 [Salix dunnii]|uniref:Uncharacterized protein n=1 Tax=Salix dunnii TaxID=1413687 RepID=A0A835TEM8_9ROSI|nr:hypothetical protein SADUNF_Sadunf03G0168700 [Salix dunnii]
MFIYEEDHENGNGCSDMVVNGGWCRILPFIPAGFFFTVDNSSSFSLVSSPPSMECLDMLDSDHRSNNRMSEAVNYQTSSSNDLARLVLSEGGWPNLLCSEKKVQQSLDLANVFVGRGDCLVNALLRLLSYALSYLLLCFPQIFLQKKNADPALVNFLKVSFTNSNFSMAFPYVVASEEAMENSLVSGFAEACGQDLEISNVAFAESCSVDGESFQKLAKLHAFNDYLASRMEKRLIRQSNLVVFCYGGSNSMKELDQPHSDSEMFSELIDSVEMLGGKYAVLYASHPFRSIQLPYHRELERFLAEGAGGNASVNSNRCDEVCQIKSSLLKGVLCVSFHALFMIVLFFFFSCLIVEYMIFCKDFSLLGVLMLWLLVMLQGIVLLIILIPGLCFMMGIDTPTIFEAPQDS